MDILEIFFMKIIHTADLHIDSPLGGLSFERSKKRRQEILFTFGNICRLAREQDARAVLICGDLCDKGIVASSSTEYILSAVKRASPTIFFYLRGNHDTIDPFDGLSLPENFIPMSNLGQSYTLCDSVTVTSFESSDSLVGCPPFSPENFNIVLYHGEISPIVSDLSGKNIDYLALGHYHTRDFGKIDDRGIWLYPGCPNGRGFDECGEKSVELLEIEEKKTTHDAIVMSDRIYHDVAITVDGIDGGVLLADKVEDRLSQIPDSDCVRVEFVGKLRGGLSTQSPMITELTSRFFGSKIVDSTKIALDNVSGDGLSLRSKFVELVGASDADDETKELALKYAFAALSGEDISL